MPCPICHQAMISLQSTFSNTGLGLPISAKMEQASLACLSQL